MSIFVETKGDIPAKPKFTPPPIVSSEELKAEEPKFVCMLINLRVVEVPVIICGRRGAVVLTPTQRFPLEMYDARVPEARYDQIVFEDGGGISAKVNRDWENPYAEFPFCLELINSDDTEQSIRIIPPAGADIFGVVDGFVTVDPGLRRTVPVDIIDPLVAFSAVEWMLVREKRPIPGYPNYLRNNEQLEQVKTARSERELAKINALRKEKLLAAL